MDELLTISKNPSLPLAQNFQELRNAGLEYIRALGSSIWTDYNIHDPGITMLEVLCYAITDCGYRATFKIKDLLAEPDGTANPDLFTARTILHNKAITTADYRKLFIDLPGIHNAWLDATDKEAEQLIYADCQNDRLTYEETEHPIILRGFYDILLEFDPYHDQFGDLNDSNLFYLFQAAELVNLYITINLPSWEEVQAAFSSINLSDATITLINLNPVEDRKNWLVSLNIAYTVDGQNEQLDIVDAPINLLNIPPNVDIQNVNFENWLSTALVQTDANSMLGQYQQKLKLIFDLVQSVHDTFHANRNLCEDLLQIRGVGVEDISFCADITLALDADIEEVLARIYFEIQNYFQPSVQFFSLSELLSEGRNTDDIFEGPALQHGFIDNDQLAETQLRTHLYTSDLINIIADIEGVISISNVLLSKYDKAGRLIPPSQKWCMPISANHKARLDIDRSKILFFKSDLPFAPRMQEVFNTLQFLRGLEKQNKLIDTELDLAVPRGSFKEVSDYTSIQHDFPAAYGLGYKELAPSSSTLSLKARNKQLKAYLLFFDQLLSNYLAQLASVKSLFSFTTATDRTYSAQFVGDFAQSDRVYRRVPSPDDPSIDELIIQRVFEEGPLSEEVGLRNIWYEIVESESDFLSRRNRFLDHLIARFAEEFSNYTFLLYTAGERNEQEREKIRDKMRFLQDYPIISSERAKAFNYQAIDGDSGMPDIWETENVSGLQKRLSRLIGVNNIKRRTICRLEIDTSQANFQFQIRDRLTSNNLLIASNVISFPTEEASIEAANRVLSLAQDIRNFQINTDNPTSPFFLIVDENGQEVARNANPFSSEEEMTMAIEQIQTFIDEETIHVFEHILLRPKRLDDKLLTVCLNKNCLFCGEEDPYSFRITLVLPGWTERFQNINFRQYVEKIARLETPAHIALKLCWPGKDQFLTLQEHYQAWLEEQFLPVESQDPAKLTNLIETLEALITIYPEARLHDCDDGNDDNPILLNRTILGTSNSENDESTDQ